MRSGVLSSVAELPADSERVPWSFRANALPSLAWRAYCHDHVSSVSRWHVWLMQDLPGLCFIVSTVVSIFT